MSQPHHLSFGVKQIKSHPRFPERWKVFWGGGRNETTLSPFTKKRAGLNRQQKEKWRDETISAEGSTSFSADCAPDLVLSEERPGRETTGVDLVAEREPRRDG